MLLLSLLIQYLANALRRGGAGDLGDYFPKSRSNLQDIVAFFKSIKLEGLADIYAKQRAVEVTRYTTSRLKDLVAKSESNEEVCLSACIRIVILTHPFRFLSLFFPDHCLPGETVQK